MKKRIVFSAAVGIAVFIAAFAVLCPTNTFKMYSAPNTEPETVLTIADIYDAADCIVSEDGTVEPDGIDSQIIFQVPKTNAQCVALSIENSCGRDTAELYFADDFDFNSENVAVSPILEENDTVCFNLEDAEFNSVRIDINSKYKLSSISIYKEKPVLTDYKIPLSPLRVVLAIFIGAVAAVTAMLLDKKFCISEYTADKIKGNYKTSGILTLCYVGSGAIAALTEVLLTRCILGPDTLGSYFNRSRFFFVWAVIAVIAVFVCLRKDAGEKPERIFLRVMLITGIMMIVTAPLSHNSWDIDSHLRWAVGDSYFGTAYYNRAEAEFTLVHALSMVREGAAANADAIKQLNGLSEFLAYKSYIGVSLPHLPSGVFIAVSRMFGASFYEQTMCGELANLLIYAYVSYFAMKKLKSGKMILACIAFFPTNLLMATSYSYDTIVTSFIMLGMAYFITEMQQPYKPISTGDTVIMCGSFAFACIPKLIYAPLILFPFLLRKKCFGKKEYKKYYLTCVVIGFVLGILLLVKTFAQVTSGGDPRGGDVNPVQQIRFILGEPVHYARILLNFLKTYLSVGNMKNYIVNFAYFGIGSGSAVYIVLMIATAVTDKSELDRFKISALSEVYAVIVYFGLSALIATALYIAFTPIGFETINGCQPRYMVPLLFPLFVLIGNPGILRLSGKWWYNTAVMISLICVLYYNVSGFYIKAAI